MRNQEEKIRIPDVYPGSATLPKTRTNLYKRLSNKQIKHWDPPIEPLLALLSLEEVEELVSWCRGEKVERVGWYRGLDGGYLLKEEH